MMKFKMPIYVTRKDTCVASDVIKPYGGRARICPESERKAAVLRSLGVHKKKKK